MSLYEDISNSYTSIKVQSDRKKFTSILRLRHVKKYRFMSTAKPSYPVRIIDSKKLVGVKRRRHLSLRGHVEEFFEKDDVSTIDAGKKECT